MVETQGIEPCTFSLQRSIASLGTFAPILVHVLGFKPRPHGLEHRCAIRYTIRAYLVAPPGLEPETAVSKTEMISISPQGHIIKVLVTYQRIELCSPDWESRILAARRIGGFGANGENRTLICDLASHYNCRYITFANCNIGATSRIRTPTTWLEAKCASR